MTGTDDSDEGTRPPRGAVHAAMIASAIGGVLLLWAVGDGVLAAVGGGGVLAGVVIGRSLTTSSGGKGTKGLAEPFEYTVVTHEGPGWRVVDLRDRGGPRAERPRR